MSRSVALVLAWLVAASGALAVSWRGVAVVGEQVTENRPAPLTAEELGAPAPTSSTASTAAPPSSTDATASTSTPTSTSTSPATSATAAAAETRDYNLEGGNVTLRFEPSGVTVVLAQPNPGFSLDQEPERGNGWKVEFESESHRSRLVGWWDGGPQDEIREDPRH